MGLLGKIVSLTRVVRGALCDPPLRAAMETSMRGEVYALIARHGLTPPPADELPLSWYRVPRLHAPGEDDSDYVEEPVTDATVVDDEDWLLARIEGTVTDTDAGIALVSLTATAEQESVG